MQHRSNNSIYGIVNKQLDDRFALLFFCDIITEPAAFLGYTKIKQKKGAGSYGSDQYKFRTVSSDDQR